MGAILYTAVDRGRLVAGHTAGNPYSFDINFNTFTEVPKREVQEQRSLAGTLFTQFIRLDTEAVLRTQYITDAATIAQIWEWYDSVIAGETFELFVTGDTGTPGPGRDCQLVGDSFSVQRYQTLEYFAFEFNVTYDPTQVS